jgi:hypothetical protein
MTAPFLSGDDYPQLSPAAITTAIVTTGVAVVTAGTSVITAGTSVITAGTSVITAPTAATRHGWLVGGVAAGVETDVVQRGCGAVIPPPRALGGIQPKKHAVLLVVVVTEGIATGHRNRPAHRG